MKEDKFFRFLRIPILLFILLMAGCDVEMTVDVVIDEAYKDAAIQIDFVLVKKGQYEEWLAQNVDDYFTDGDTYRRRALEKDDVFTIYYNVPGQSFQSTILPDDPIWERFRRDPNTDLKEYVILVFADIPGIYPEGKFDIRKKKIPLAKEDWDKNWFDSLKKGSRRQLEITIEPTGIGLDPAPLTN